MVPNRNLGYLAFYFLKKKKKKKKKRKEKHIVDSRI